MRTLLIVTLCVCAGIGAIYGLSALSEGTSAIHEIEALISVLVIAVCSVGGLIAVEKRGG